MGQPIDRAGPFSAIGYRRLALSAISAWRYPMLALNNMNHKSKENLKSIKNQ